MGLSDDFAQMNFSKFVCRQTQIYVAVVAKFDKASLDSCFHEQFHRAIANLCFVYYNSITAPASCVFTSSMAIHKDAMHFSASQSLSRALVAIRVLADTRARSWLVALGFRSFC